MELQLNATTGHGSYTVVSVTGEVDVASAPKLGTMLSEVLASGCSKVVVDLTNVSFMDSSGLGVLVQHYKRFTAARGELRLVITEPRVLQVFEITKLTSVFSIFDSLHAAIP